jgi:hypothetical protein
MPNYKIKLFGFGYNNYPFTAKIIKIDENQIGYRGSKSNFFKYFVKEQRVDGSLCLFNKHIRYTLMGFERNYQVKCTSKQLIKNFSTFSSKTILNP